MYPYVYEYILIYFDNVKKLIEYLLFGKIKKCT